MSYRNIFFSILVFFFSVACLSLEAIQCENVEIERIDIVMMNLPEGATVNPNTILKRIKTSAGDFFCQAIFDNDLKILADCFDRVEPIIDCIDDAVYITLNVWVKPKIRHVIWNGNCKIPTEELTKELNACPGAIFDRRAFNQAFHRIKAYYVGKGFFEAELRYDLYFDEEVNQVDIQIYVEEGRSGRIKEILFDNFTEQERNDVLDLMVTKRYIYLTSWFTDQGTYREEAIQHDELIILNYLQNQGYADARVEILTSDVKGESNRINILIRAYKGEQYRVGHITFKGNTLFCDEEIRKCFLIREGKLYSPERIRETETRITELYGRSGYIDAIVTHEPRLSEEGCVYDVEFFIEEGEQYRVGLIKVFGNTCTHTRVILNETILVPGEIFNTAKLRLTENRLLNIGFFSSVNVYAVKSDEACGLGENYRDVHIEVEETSTGHFSASVGFSTAEQIFGSISIAETNFNYRGFGSIWERGLSALRGGGEYALFDVTLGQKSRKYQLSWTKPYVNDTEWMIGIDLDRSTNRYVSNDYRIEAVGGTLRGMYPVNEFVRFGCHYRLRHSWAKVRIHDKEEESGSSHEVSRSSEHLTPKQEIIERSCHSKQHHLNGTISAIGTSLTYDSTNSPLNPSRGTKSRFELEFAGVGGARHFLKVGYTNSVFFQIPEWDKKGIWQVRGDMRFIQPFGHTNADNIPLDERLFLGGEYTVRGYDPYNLGPKFSTYSLTEKKCVDTHDPRGGISLQFLSLEYVRPLMSRLEGFLFMDAGHLTDSHWTFSGHFYTSAGFGARLYVFGTAPLVIGMGFPMNPRHKHDIKRFFLTVGGRF